MILQKESQIVQQSNELSDFEQVALDKDRQVKHCKIGTGQCNEPDLNRQANQTSPGKANPTISMTIKATTPRASARMVSRERAITDLISSAM